MGVSLEEPQIDQTSGWTEVDETCFEVCECVLTSCGSDDGWEGYSVRDWGDLRSVEGIPSHLIAFTDGLPQPWRRSGKNSVHISSALAVSGPSETTPGCWHAGKGLSLGG